MVNDVVSAIVLIVAVNQLPISSYQLVVKRALKGCCSSAKNCQAATTDL